MATSAQVRDEILAGKWDETLGALYSGGAAELRRQRARYAAALEMICVSIAVVNRGQRQEEAKIKGSAH